MVGILHTADTVLRGPAGQRAQPTLFQVGTLIVLFGMIYGCVMGSFSASSIDRLLLIVFSAVKVPILLLVTFLISLPSFFVLNTLLGMRADFAAAVRALITTQAALTIILASLAPFTALWYASNSEYGSAIFFNGVMFAVASFSAQLLLRKLYRPLIERNPRHRVLLRLWLVIYVFVGVQMGWVLRPFVGSPTSPVRFFREEAFSNSYIVVGQLIWEQIMNVLGR